MKLVDTSSWIEQLREDGDPTVRARVNALLESGEACWCSVVRLELWIGARGDHEKKVMRRYEAALPELKISPDVWEESFDLARTARTAGITCPCADVLIAACARYHDVEVESADTHLAQLMSL
jgi:predicted nucleic acid-binding protein